MQDLARPAEELAAALSPGEQLVWAATFAQVLIGGSSQLRASRSATRAVQRLREVEVDKLPAAERAAVEQMRGAR